MKIANHDAKTTRFAPRDWDRESQKTVVPHATIVDSLAKVASGRNGRIVWTDSGEDDKHGRRLKRCIHTMEIQNSQEGT